MEHRIKNIIRTMDYADLIDLSRSVKDGNFNFNNVIKETVKEKEKEHRKYCSVCGNDMDPFSTSNFTILFGPEDFKKKASFCAYDCMESFITRMKEIKQMVKNE